ncbi:dihydrolipoamide acetyltransferase family protein [Nocardia pseudovaccinii]|uniref:dihydrolipoamide acetyltransferase family protein n=1 Tax=Nocardia pseudovaccinii TaxID=189540 RepID=UPI000AE6A76E|nr:dihydrolipoamide acetyltransferase family protein [Nocardia pseudovaccinii]
MPDIIMPRLSDTMEEGVVVAWLKQVGDKVSRGDILAEIETDKALMELEAYEDGILEQILFEPGSRVPIGNTIALIGDGTGSAAGGSAGPNPAAESGVASSDTAKEPVVPPGRGGAQDNPIDAAGTVSAATETRTHKKSSPLARKIARELDIDLATVTGTGPGGRVTRNDVESAYRTIESTPVAPPVASMTASGDYDEIPLSTIQQVSAKRLTESKQQAPHIYLTSAIDVTDLLAFRAEINRTLEQAGKTKVSVNDLLVKAVATALRTDPAVNVSIADDKLLRHRGIHLGIAVATPAGLLVPVVRDADRKSVSEIATETRDKAERARDRKLRADEMSGGTFTISNLGMFGIEQFTAVINPPESAILAVGAAKDELRLDGSQVVTRSILRVTLSADHRAIDGATAARFLQQLTELLEHPLRIIA